jgi:flagellar hook-associated protein 3 FlgL
VFGVLGEFITALEGGTNVSDAVSKALGGLDAGLDRVLTTRAQIGSQLVEVEQLGFIGGDLDLQYATTLSNLQDLDYNEAISRLTQQQTYLQAAQQSFLKTTGLSLFNYLS